MPLRSTPFKFSKTAYQSDSLSVVLCSLSRENVQSFTEVEDIYCIVKNVFDYHSIRKTWEKGSVYTWRGKTAFVMLACLCDGAFACRCSSVLHKPDDHHKRNDGQ